MSKRFWTVGGAVALLLATGGYYASAHTGLIQAGKIHTTTTAPEPGYRIKDWITGGHAAATTTPSVRPTTAITATQTQTPVTRTDHARAATSSQASPQPPTKAQIKQRLAYYSVPHNPGAATDYFPEESSTFRDGHGGLLTVVVGSPPGDGQGNLLFVWHNQRFLGITTAEGSFLNTLHAAPDGFRVTYYAWSSSLPVAQWQRSNAAKATTITYTWDPATQTIEPSRRGHFPTEGITTAAPPSQRPAPSSSPVSTTDVAGVTVITEHWGFMPFYVSPNWAVMTNTASKLVEGLGSPYRGVVATQGLIEQTPATNYAYLWVLDHYKSSQSLLNLMTYRISPNELAWAATIYGEPYAGYLVWRRTTANAYELETITYQNVPWAWRQLNSR